MTFAEHCWQNREAAPHALALSRQRLADGDSAPAWAPAQVAAQVAALQKIRRKVPAWYRPDLIFPSALSVAQASSEATAQFKASHFSGKKMLDLTGGLGVDAYFFSKNFEQVTLIEQQPELLATVRQNFAALGATNVQFVAAEATNFLKNSGETFDLIYLDPARRDAAGGRVFQLADCSPNVLEIKDLLFEKSPQILLKTAPLLDLTLATRQLENVVKIWVVGAADECREVLYLLRRGSQILPEKIPICVATLGSDLPEFAFSAGEEAAASVEFSLPENFLFEPFPAVLKAGAFRTFAQRFGLKKLHANTHLYTAETRGEHLPARVFRILTCCKFDKKTVRKWVPGGQANVAVRNFPLGAEAVRQQLGLRDGGEVFLFACTLADGQRAVLICEKGSPTVEILLEEQLIFPGIQPNRTSKI